MNANTENSQIKHCPCPKYFKVRNFCETKVTNFHDFLANSRKFVTAKYLIWKHSPNLIHAKMFNSSDTNVSSRVKYFFLQELIKKKKLLVPA